MAGQSRWQDPGAAGPNTHSQEAESEKHAAGFLEPHSEGGSSYFR